MPAHLERVSKKIVEFSESTEEEKEISNKKSPEEISTDISPSFPTKSSKKEIGEEEEEENLLEEKLSKNEMQVEAVQTLIGIFNVFSLLFRWEEWKNPTKIPSLCKVVFFFYFSLK